MDEIEKARESLGEAKMKTIISNLSRDKKLSTDENEEKVKRYQSAANSQHERTIDSKHLADISWAMDEFRKLLKKKTLIFFVSKN